MDKIKSNKVYQCYGEESAVDQELSTEQPEARNIQHSNQDHSSQQASEGKTTDLIDNRYAEYSPKTLADIEFIKETHSNSYDQECNQQTPESYITANDFLHFDSSPVKVTYDVDTNDDVGSWPPTDSSSDCDSESSSICEYPISPEDSFLMKLELPLTESEKSLIDEFYKEMENVVEENKQEFGNSIHNPNVNCTQNALKRVENTTNKYLEKGIRLNSKYNETTVTTLVFEEMENILERSKCGNKGIYDNPNDDALYNRDNRKIISNIIRDNRKIISNIIKKLLLRGGKIKQNYDCRLLHITNKIRVEIFSKYKEIQNKLKNVAYESIVNKEDHPEVEIDNGYFGIKYSQSSIVKVAKILNNQEVKDLNLKVGILQIGKSIVRVETIENRRNYVDIFESGIKMSFTTEAGKISIYLHPDKTDSNKVKVELDKENQEKFNKLKNKSNLEKNCLLGGKSVLQAIKDGEFIKNKEPPSSFMEKMSISHIFDGLKNCFKQFGKSMSGG